MNDINSYSVSGRLGQDAELIYFGDGTPSLKFRIASSRFLRKEDGTGKPQYDTLWLNCQKVGDGVEGLQPYMQRGRWIAVEGELRSYQSDDMKAANKPPVIFVHAFKVTFPPQPSGSGGNGQRQEGGMHGDAPALAPAPANRSAPQTSAAGQQRQAPAPAQGAAARQPQPATGADDDDSYPF